MTRSVRRDGPHRLSDLSRHAVMPLGALDTTCLRAWAEEEGHRFAEVSLADARDRKAALRAIGRALGFPKWYGANLDALYDCVTDLAEHLHGKGLVLVLDPIPEHAGFTSEDREALLDVFRDAAEAFEDQSVDLRVLYR